MSFFPSVCFLSFLPSDFSSFLPSVFGIDQDDAASFSLVDYDLTNRPKTENYVAWSPGEWERSKEYESPDCTELVQAIVNRPGWQAGNAIGFVIDGKGSRTATAYDGNIHYGPVLKIRYRKQAESK